MNTLEYEASAAAIASGLDIRITRLNGYFQAEVQLPGGGRALLGEPGTKSQVFAQLKAVADVKRIHDIIKSE